MGLRSGLKKIGRGIKKGVKKGVKAVDKFDDWIKLKELAQIGQFIPGVNVIAKPLAMTYSGFDTAKNLKEGDLMKAAMSGASMYGSSKIDTGGIGSWGELAEGVQGPTRGFRNALQDNITGNLKNYAGGFSNPLGLMDKYAGLDKGSKFAIDTLAPPILGSLQGGQRQSRGPSSAPYQSYQPIDYGNIAGFSPTTQLPTQAQGGITGDDYGPGSLYELDEMMDARDDYNRRYWHKKDLEEGIPSQFDRPAGGSPWPAPGKSTRPLGPFRDYAGELGLTPWMFDTLLDARIGRENRLRGPSQREMEEIEAEQHGWLPGLTPEEKLQSYQEAVERSKRYEPSDHWQDPTLPKISPLARGGITGDDWHRPINRLPANYEGWVTQPSLATLGEAGKEAVLPLNKLLPAMNKGGLNYSPGQAIVGEAGPEYVTRLGPGEEQYAQSILREQPVPQMQEGGVAGGSSYWDQMKRMVRFALGNPEKAKSMLGKAGRTFSRRLFPGAMWLDQPSNLLNAIQGQVEYKPPMDKAIEAVGLDPRWQMGERYGWRDFGREGIEAALASVPLAGIPLSTAWSLAMDPERPQRPFAGPMSAQQHGQDVQVPPGTSENQMLQGMMRGENFANPYAAQAYSNGQRVNWPSGISENQMVQLMATGQINNTPASRTPVQAVPQTSVQTGDPLELLRQMTLEEDTGDIDPRFLDEETPSFMGERTSEGDPRGHADPLWETDVSFQAASPKERIDLSLLDNDNARYWTTGEGSRRSPNRLYQMIRDLGYGDTREQVEKMKWNAKERNNEKWYRGGVAKPRPRPIPYPGVPPG